jgi:hypothetical protein
MKSGHFNLLTTVSKLLLSKLLRRRRKAVTAEEDHSPICESTERRPSEEVRRRAVAKVATPPIRQIAPTISGIRLVLLSTVFGAVSLGTLVGVLGTTSIA